MSIPAPNKATEQEVKRLLKRLSRAKDDWPSEPALRALSPQMVTALMKRVEQEGRANRRLRTVFGVLALLSVYFLQIGTYGIYGGVMITSVVAGAVLRSVLEPRKRYSLYALTQTDDMRTLPTLIKAAYDENRRHPQVKEAICRLLRQVMETDAGLLNKEVQSTLWFIGIAQIWQETLYDEALAVSALQAFALVGNRETLHRMQNFARLRPATPAHRRVNALIEQLIPVMEERLQRQEVPQILMRASEAVVVAPDI